MGEVASLSECVSELRRQLDSIAEQSKVLHRLLEARDLRVQLKKEHPASASVIKKMKAKVSQLQEQKASSEAQCSKLDGMLEESKARISWLEELLKQVGAA